MIESDIRPIWLETGYRVAATVDMLIDCYFIPADGIIELLWMPGIDTVTSSYGFRPRSVMEPAQSKVILLNIEDGEHILDAFFRASGQPDDFFELVH